MFKSIRRLLTALTVVLVVSAPSVASAMIPLEPLTGAPTSAQAPLSAPRAAASSESFQWGDAGVGAAGVLALVGLGSGAVLAIRRRPRHRLAS
jgi:hypothetical protein